MKLKVGTVHHQEEQEEKFLRGQQKQHTNIYKHSTAKKVFTGTIELKWVLICERSRTCNFRDI